jgi:hypothetical protein
MPQRKIDELPYASAAEPDDPGVALRWTDAGNDYAIAAPPASSDVDQRELHEILEVAPDADPSVVEAAYWAKIQEAHPDRGGSQEAFECVNATRDAMLDK